MKPCEPQRFNAPWNRYAVVERGEKYLNKSKKGEGGESKEGSVPSNENTDIT